MVNRRGGGKDEEVGRFKKGEKEERWSVKRQMKERGRKRMRTGRQNGEEKGMGAELRTEW